MLKARRRVAALSALRGPYPRRLAPPGQFRSLAALRYGRDRRPEHPEHDRFRSSDDGETGPAVVCSSVLWFQNRLVLQVAPDPNATVL